MKLAIKTEKVTRGLLDVEYEIISGVAICQEEDGEWVYCVTEEKVEKMIQQALMDLEAREGEE